MKRYVTLSRLVLVFAVLIMAVFAVSVSAEGEDTVPLPSINDGRVNNFDIDAPVAIYDIYVYPYADDVNMGVLASCRVLGSGRAESPGSFQGANRQRSGGLRLVGAGGVQQRLQPV